MVFDEHCGGQAHPPAEEVTPAPEHHAKSSKFGTDTATRFRHGVEFSRVSVDHNFDGNRQERPNQSRFTQSYPATKMDQLKVGPGENGAADDRSG